MLLTVTALIEPLAVAVRAVRTSGATPSSKVLMLGGGPIGLVIILILKALGINNIVVSEPSPGRRDINKQVGASAVLDPTSFPLDDFPKHVSAAFNISSATADKGDTLADVAFDCAGVPASLTAAFSGTKARAMIVNVAVWEKPPQFPMNQLVFREKTYKGTAAPEHQDFEDVLKLFREGKIKNAEKVVTKTVKLEDADKEGFAVLTKAGGTGEGKVLVEIGGGE
jgi:threonine dehydrogenase-like Zn-dependent dehydrogenase